jgi:hypothetical protein
MKFEDFTGVLKINEDFISMHKESFVFNFCKEHYVLGEMQKVQEIIFLGFSSTNVSIQYMFASGVIELVRINIKDFKHWVENTSTIDVHDESTYGSLHALNEDEDQELPCPYKQELYGDHHPCNCTASQRHECSMDI